MSRRNQISFWNDWRLLSFLFLFLFLFGFTLAKDLKNVYLIKKHGVIGEGKIFGVEHRLGKGGYFYAARYIFNYNHTTYFGEAVVMDAWAKTAVVPEPVQIQFVPENPNLSRAPNIGNHRSLAEEIRQLIMVLTVLSAVLACILMRLIFIWRIAHGDEKSRPLTLRQMQLPSYPKSWH